MSDRARRVRAAVDAPAIDGAEAVPATDIQTPEAAVLDAKRRRTVSDALTGRVRTRIRAGMIAMCQRLEHAV